MKPKDKAEEFASKFKTAAQRYAAESGFREAQRMQLEDDLECTKLFIKRLCIIHKLPLDLVEQFEKEMRQ